ncbi:GNAT family N-acetyltransferase [Frankia sp. AgB1.9]|uniref:GNAT family N-acetyltransferase n=2 Tax=unclassified Frankia TaxID=2632575 RepID=UPI001EE4B2ED|nr:GNAT family N-acetyltransferase [Frankia sp. AgB1.9]
MGPDDLGAAEALSAIEFGKARSPAYQLRWRTRTGHLLATDPGGCWAADDDAGLAGFAVSFRRESNWLLATFAVRGDLQGAGLGRRLLDAALAHGAGCERGMISASADVKAFRRYRAAGFSLHPQLSLTGRVDRAALPAGLAPVREGTGADRDLLDDLDRRRRGATHGPDHEVLASQCRLIVLDRPAGTGYAYLDDAGAAVLLCATDEGTATALLWEAVASSAPDADYEIAHVTAANEWAIDVGLAVRLAPATEGYLALRGLAPPVPYLHNGALL